METNWRKKFSLINFSRNNFEQSPPKPNSEENCIILIAKFYIYRTRCMKDKISTVRFEQYLKNYIDVELQIAKNKGKVSSHQNKWENTVEQKFHGHVQFSWVINALQQRQKKKLQWRYYSVLQLSLISYSTNEKHCAKNKHEVFITNPVKILCCL